MSLADKHCVFDTVYECRHPTLMNGKPAVASIKQFQLFTNVHFVDGSVKTISVSEWKEAEHEQVRRETLVEDIADLFSRVKVEGGIKPQHVMIAVCDKCGKAWLPGSGCDTHRGCISD